MCVEASYFSLLIRVNATKAQTIVTHLHLRPTPSHSHSHSLVVGQTNEGARTNKRDRITETNTNHRMVVRTYVRSFVRSFVSRSIVLVGFNDIARHTCTNKQCIIWLLCIAVAVKFIAFWLVRFIVSTACWLLFPFNMCVCVCMSQNRNENYSFVLAHTDEE